MNAVVKTGGKQYAVSEGDLIDVELLEGSVGDKIELTDVLSLGTGDDLKVGTPTVEGASVLCEVVGEGRGKKVIVFKKKRRKGYKKKQGHRQGFISLRVAEIKG